jgi:hypothetical protein
MASASLLGLGAEPPAGSRGRTPEVGDILYFNYSMISA